MKTVKLLLLLLGGLLLVFFIWRMGFSDILSNLQTLSWKFLLLVGFASLWDVVCTAAWSMTLFGEAGYPKFRSIYCARMAGEAFNVLTPFMNMGGEPVKVYLMRKHVPVEKASASVIIDRTIHTLAGLAFVLIGVGFGISKLVLPLSLKLALCGGLFIFALKLALLLIIQQKKPATALLKLLSRFKKKTDWLEAKKQKAALLDASLAQFYQKGKRRFAFAFLLHFTGRILRAGEMWLILHFWGVDVTFGAAWLIAAVTTAINTVSAFIPGSMGISEGGQAFVLANLGLSASLGLSMGIVRRLRLFSWNIVGLALMFIQEKSTKEKIRNGRSFVK